MTAARAVATEAPTAAEQLHRLAAQVGRLLPDRRDPERFHRDKSEVEVALRRLARELERGSR